MRLPFKIVKNPPLPKMERKLELDHFHTFKNGHSIYTYKVEDLTHISGRYLDQVKNTINFMIQYNSGPDQVNRFCKDIQGFAKTALDGATDKTESLIKIHTYAGEMPKLKDYVEDLELKMWHDLYVMFFVLDGEPETAFSPKQNQLKIDYLNTCTDEEKESFFLFVKQLMISFSSTYKEDTMNSLISQGQMVSLVESLLNPIRTQNFTSNAPDTVGAT